MAEILDADSYSLSERLKTSRSISPHFIVDKSPNDRESCFLSALKKKKLSILCEEAVTVKTDLFYTTSKSRGDPSIKRRELDPSIIPLPCLPSWISRSVGSIIHSKEIRNKFMNSQNKTQNDNPGKVRVQERINRIPHFKTIRGSHLFSNKSHLKIKFSSEKGQFQQTQAIDMEDRPPIACRVMNMLDTMEEENRVKDRLCVLDSQTLPNPAQITQNQQSEMKYVVHNSDQVSDSTSNLNAKPFLSRSQFLKRISLGSTLLGNSKKSSNLMMARPKKSKLSIPRGSVFMIPAKPASISSQCILTDATEGIELSRYVESSKEVAVYLSTASNFSHRKTNYQSTDCGVSNRTRETEENPLKHVKPILKPRASFRPTSRASTPDSPKKEVRFSQIREVLKYAKLS